MICLFGVHELVAGYLSIQHRRWLEVTNIEGRKQLDKRAIFIPRKLKFNL